MSINERILIGYIKKGNCENEKLYKYLNNQPLCAQTNYKFKSYNY